MILNERDFLGKISSSKSIIVTMSTFPVISAEWTGPIVIEVDVKKGISRTIFGNKALDGWYCASSVSVKREEEKRVDIQSTTNLNQTE